MKHEHRELPKVHYDAECDSWIARGGDITAFGDDPEEAQRHWWEEYEWRAQMDYQRDMRTELHT
jgi:hypothetical protein